MEWSLLFLLAFWPVPPFVRLWTDNLLHLKTFLLFDVGRRERGKGGRNARPILMHDNGQIKRK